MQVTKSNDYENGGMSNFTLKIGGKVKEKNHQITGVLV